MALRMRGKRPSDERGNPAPFDTGHKHEEPPCIIHIFNVRIESPVTLFTFICWRRPKIKEHRRNHAQSRPNRALRKRERQRCSLQTITQRTPVCARSHTKHRWPPYKREPPSLSDVFRVYSVGFDRNVWKSQCFRLVWPDFSPADINITIYRVGVQGKFKKFL